MLNSVLKDAIKKHDETLSILKGPKFEQIVKEAKSNWIDFRPQNKMLLQQELTVASIAQNFRVRSYGQSLQFPLNQMVKF